MISYYGRLDLECKPKTDMADMALKFKEQRELQIKLDNEKARIEKEKRDIAAEKIRLRRAKAKG